MDREVSTTDTFSSRLTLALEVLNLSRGQLAQAVGVDKSVVSRWASGATEPTAYNLARISEALAREKPGFNMTLWDKPRAEFEAFLGVQAAPVSAASASVKDRTQARVPLRTIGVALIAVMLTAAVILLLFRFGGSDKATPGKPADDASIGVLPFVNMSGDSAKDYLSDGFSEELLNDLANTPQIRVAARTSSFQFKGRGADVRDIGERLHVRTVLEGSVRESGDRVRITAQLIDAASGYHIWSQTYDRQLTDILKVQSDISRSIADTLTEKLVRKSTAAARLAIEPDAYRKYLLGKTYFAHGTLQDNARAIALFQDVTTLEPDFAEGYAMLAYASLRKEWVGSLQDFHDAVIRAAVDRALSLDPRNITALVVSMNLAFLKQDWEKAGRVVARLQEINPRHIEVVRATGRYYQSMGFPERALSNFALAAKLDPLSSVAWGSLAVAYAAADRNKEAVAAGETALALAPDYPDVIAWVCVAHAQLGDLAAARRLAARLAEMPEGAQLKGCELEIALSSGDLAKARAIVDYRARNNAGDPAYIGQNYLQVGEVEKALPMLERAYDEGDIVLYVLAVDPVTPRDFLKTPGWIALTRKPRFRQWQAAHDKLEKGGH